LPRTVRHGVGIEAGKQAASISRVLRTLPVVHAVVGQVYLVVVARLVALQLAHTSEQGERGRAVRWLDGPSSFGPQSDAQHGLSQMPETAGV